MDNQTNDQKSIKQTSTPPNSINPETSTLITTENPISTITEIPVPETELPPLQPQSEIEEAIPSDEYKNEYQDVLDQYAATQETPPPIIPPPTLTDLGITSTPPQNNIFKIVFIISLIVFVLTATVLAFTYFKSQNNQESSTPSTIIEVAPTQTVSDTCFLNDKTYQAGESFTATDGCNTCTCVSQNNINCTDKECSSSKSATESAANSTKTATSSSIPKDWKTYTDSQYNFSINYPSTWTKETKLTNDEVFAISSPEKIKSLQDPNNHEGYSGDDINIQVYKDYKNSLTKNQSLEEYLKNNELFSNVKKTKIGNIDSYVVDEGGMAITPAYFIINSNNVFKITSFLIFSQTELKILDSFKLN
ncbi:MAG: PsbP-related protein [Candidatus Shapirobacteria bacterium]|jgi:hypothetical protein